MYPLKNISDESCSKMDKVTFTNLFKTERTMLVVTVVFILKTTEIFFFDSYYMNQKENYHCNYIPFKVIVVFLLISYEPKKKLSLRSYSI